MSAPTMQERTRGRRRARTVASTVGAVSLVALIAACDSSGKSGDASGDTGVAGTETGSAAGDTGSPGAEGGRDANAGGDAVGAGDASGTGDGSGGVDGEAGGLPAGSVWPKRQAVRTCADQRDACVAGCDLRPAGMPAIPFCHAYCANRFACCQDWPIPAGDKPSFATADTIPAAPTLCRTAAMWNAQGQTPYLCPVPTDAAGGCPCPSGMAKCPPYPLAIPQDLAP